MNDKSLMPFGKHKGKMLQDIPASYLIWFMEQDFSVKQWPELHAYCKKNYKSIEQDAREEEETWRECMESGANEYDLY